ncbi:glycoside hydrolase family 16 protein [Gordonia sp. NPDC057258]|uniref:glycoside hydrolase family 16 protein n=1 Tax=unclassified Gordonia (in: high G+C Gram-positive bacteria) TaxID=2657482 RepID=UPI00362FDE26
MNRHRGPARAGRKTRRYLWSAVALAIVGALVLIGGHQLGVGSSSADSERCTATAAQRGGWGSPSRLDHFDTAASLDNWWIYDGPGHDGNGRRTPEAVSVSDGNLIITARADGSSGGMAVKGGGSKYGRWEICARATVAAPTWHAVALLWPDANDWPVGGEIDFMEIIDPLRRTVEYNLHYGAQDDIEHHRVDVDATKWHSWAVEWTPRRIAVFLDGVLWAQSTDVSRFPPRSMHLCLQVDNFGGVTVPGGQMFVDRVAEYPV